MITYVEYPANLMKTGDILIARRFTGHTTEVMLLAGSLANHAAMVVKEHGSEQVYVIDCFHDSWGETGSGVQKTIYDKWLEAAEDEGFEVVYLPIDAQLVQDESKLMDWFNLVEGRSYDFATELFAAIDSPDLSVPPPFNSEVLPVLLRLSDNWHYGDDLLT